MIKNFVLAVVVLACMAVNVMAGHRHVVKHKHNRHGTSTRVYSSSNGIGSTSYSTRVSTGYTVPRVQVRARSSCPGGNCP